jgi:hypothetical protein
MGYYFRGILGSRTGHSVVLVSAALCSGTSRGSRALRPASQRCETKRATGHILVSHAAISTNCRVSSSRAYAGSPAFLNSPASKRKARQRIARRNSKSTLAPVATNASKPPAKLASAACATRHSMPRCVEAESDLSNFFAPKLKRPSPENSFVHALSALLSCPVRMAKCPCNPRKHWPKLPFFRIGFPLRCRTCCHPLPDPSRACPAPVPPVQVLAEVVPDPLLLLTQ